MTKISSDENNSLDSNNDISMLRFLYIKWLIKQVRKDKKKKIKCFRYLLLKEFKDIRLCNYWSRRWLKLSNI